MRYKHETIEGANISVWDCGDKFVDRYTVVFLDDIERGQVPYLAMSAYPFSPQGFCQHGDMPIGAVQYEGRGGAFKRRIKFADLPLDCQKAVIQDIHWED